MYSVAEYSDGPKYPALLSKAVEETMRDKRVLFKMRNADVALLEAHKKDMKCPLDIKRANETIRAIKEGERVYGGEV